MHRYEYAASLLKQGHPVTLEVYGHSMMPTITHGSEILITPFKGHVEALSLYEIIFVFYQHQYYLHRIISLDQGIQMKGDHDPNIQIVDIKDILGVYQDPLYHPFKAYIHQLPYVIYDKHVIQRHELHILENESDHSLKMQLLMTLKQEAFDTLKKICVTKDIKLLILKGYALDEFYQDHPYLRTKGDVDLMIVKNHEAFIDVITSLGYVYQSHNTYHTVYQGSYLTIELHKSLGVDLEIYESDIVIQDDKTYHLNHQKTYLYLLLHIKKHLKHGGIGFKHVMDLYMMERLNDRTFLKRYRVESLYLYIMSIFDLIFSKPVDPSIHLESLYQLMSDIKSYGVHGSAKIRLKRMKGTPFLFQRYIKDKQRFQHIKHTLTHNSCKMLCKKIILYINASPLKQRKIMLRHLEVL